ncbi:hypothetical protein M433DRAFT_61006 [Acidomyces richmondensis BFW]|nr:MAG: hypothetical protein FE78DRAFT_95502 [Acidomyces sp. 'richmondensis']KYG48508.1 hypothetical protein M433DRAFT_61006 [Acidomyces richmondensis BFW]
MLVRSAGRTRHRNTSQLLAASFAQLTLPWLAPAQLRWSASHSRLALASNSASDPRRRRPSLSKLEQAKGQARRLATAADQFTLAQDGKYPPPGYRLGHGKSVDSKDPWDHFQLSKNAQTRVSDLRPYDDPIIINSTLQQPGNLIRVQNGVHGTVIELLQHLHISLRIGRLNRAEAIIQRLADQSPPTSPELLHAHTAYLTENLRLLSSEPRGSEQGKQTLKKAQRWFEVEVRKNGIQPDAKLLVVMIRVAIRGLEGKSRDRAIRRYADLAKVLAPDEQDEVLLSEDYDDNEFTILGSVTSELYEESEEPPSEQASDTTDPQRTAEAPAAYRPTRAVDLDTLPEVRATIQKGDGLSNIKRAMQVLVDNPALPPEAPIEAQHERAYERQRLMEETSVEIAINQWRKADEDLRKIGINTAMQSKPIGALMWQWYQQLLPDLEKELAEVKALLNQPDKTAEMDRYHYGPYLELLPPQKIAANTILFVMSKMARGKNQETGNYESEAKLTQLTVGLGKILEAECAAEASMRRPVGQRTSTSRGTRRIRRAILQKLKAKGPDALTEQEKSTVSQHDVLALSSWPLTPKVKLGAMLIQKLMENAYIPVTREHPRTKEKVTQMQPAFLHRVKYIRGKKLGVVQPNPALVEKLQSEPISSLIVKRMPMIVKPKPWRGWSNGGYIHYANPIMRITGDKSSKDYFLAADRKGDMEQLYAGLNALGKVPWRVHPDVLKVQIEAWNTGEEIANFAPLNRQFTVPPAPEPGSDPHIRRQWLKEVQAIQNKRGGLHSKRCFQNFQLEIARALANETLYFPHSIDFRGRAYPIPPYLNHMGADNVRGLLVFAEGKPLGENGLRWLKIHTATVAGHDKASMEERLQFVEDHLDDIYDSVRDPLGGRRWWLQAEDAWQTLAACFELTAALDSPDPTKFISTLPIQQDGTCNGLQHYAALGGDEIGARQVNLEPGDRPSDVYTAVAEAVKEEVKKDAEQGHPIAQQLHGRITRKCVKQPVMTNVYGVTFYGAKEQVQRQLEVLFPEVNNRETLARMSLYIATKIFKSLGSMFQGAQAIQHWLGQCADRIATCLTPEQIQYLSVNQDVQTKPKRKSRKAETSQTVLNLDKKMSEAKERKAAQPMFKSTVVWTTPLRLPVVQPYRKTGSKEIRTNLQNIALAEPQVWDPVSKRKQLQAFPPNFIHSLDATHMILSVLKCNEAGLTFASIHDSFWTHACDVDTLNTILRDAFVQMHSEDIIGRLREEFETRYKDCMYMASVVSTSPIAKKITAFRKKQAGNSKSSELLLEIERIRLLNSEDAAERAKGEAMVTPGSIYLSHGDESDLAEPNELAGQSLGSLPDGEAANTDSNALSPEYPESSKSSEGIVGEEVLDQDTEGLAEAESSAIDANDDVVADDVDAAAPAKNATKKSQVRKINVWLPMKFPEVPKKGSFDVRRLRESTYFFH